MADCISNGAVSPNPLAAVAAVWWRRGVSGDSSASGNAAAARRRRWRRWQLGGSAAVAAAAARRLREVRWERGGGGGGKRDCGGGSMDGSAAVAWRRWRWRQCGSSAAAAEAAAAWRRQRVGGGVGREAAACCSITDLEALYLWRNPVFRIKKAEKVNFYLRHNFKEKWNLSLDFQRIQIYSIANKNQKRITADTQYVEVNKK